jgi:hypothetical protein
MYGKGYVTPGNACASMLLGNECIMMKGCTRNSSHTTHIPVPLRIENPGDEAEILRISSLQSLAAEYIGAKPEKLAKQQAHHTHPASPYFRM